MPIRVLVVEDSETVRRRIVDALTQDAAFLVVGEAADGASAIDRCRALRPDVITLDMMLPGLTGLEATEYIMGHLPTPILIVSASTNRGELFRTYDALAAGAIDVLEKPRADDDGSWDHRLRDALLSVSRIRPITHIRSRLAGAVRPIPSQIARTDNTPSCLAIGASTGGPGAVATLLRGLPAPFPLPILLVVHISEPFGASLADWLGKETGHRVEIARGTAALQPGVLLAPPGRHLAVRGASHVVVDLPARHYCRPSVDVLFESVATELGPNGIGCLLTGMGRDGASGLLAIRTAGGTTLAQDEASSVVWGMPREAIRIDAAMSVVGIDKMAAAIAALVRR